MVCSTKILKENKHEVLSHVFILISVDGLFLSFFLISVISMCDIQQCFKAPLIQRVVAGVLEDPNP
jgi:hypothetical protein